MRTMFVFQNSYCAEEAGFRNGIHKNNRDWRACWPGCSHVHLTGVAVEAIIVSPYANVDLETSEGNFRQILKSRQKSFENPIWMEL